MSFRTSDAASSPAVDLVAAMWAEIKALYPRIGNEDGPSATPADFSPPGGAFVVGFDGETPVAGGGVKRLDDAAAEIKRMYVAPAARGSGAGRQLLGALEDAARELGYSVVRLDTGRFQGSALRMFQQAGYRPIADYNGNPYASFWGERAL
ncbi:MAG: GNAT family N-acetyltransferase [Solirubrobacteraceae bacterium]